MSDIPSARERLRGIADRLRPVAPAIANELEIVVDTMLVRERSARRAPRASIPVSAKTRDTIKAFAKRNPSRHLSEIAAHYCMNPGRVSEIINGKWDHL